MTRSIKKLLVANRGEIACRIMRTCREMGIETVAVYSEADAKSMHTEMADMAVHIGAAPATESYLCADKILQAAKDTGADAIHPGYGFLSENPGFAENCQKEGIIFVGPPASAMQAMALKDSAKKLMDDAGVPTVPGYHGSDQSVDALVKAAEEIGFPVLIKAVAGGGGKGMRMVEAAEDLRPAIEAAVREGENSFGNGDVLIEKYIKTARHIELQVFADKKGNAVHLFERDCSIQRRHQKVIEEAPAPDMPIALREAMGDAAVKAAQAIGYEGAGTVEFIVDASKGLETARFYFMEMNTRLQVEHPVTEMITGQDLVAWQIDVAAGKDLPLDQLEINEAVTGHAIEVRLYAENPYQDFVPATGAIRIFDTEKGQSANRRIDTGVRAGDEVTIHYDPMIAKMIAKGDTRDAAIANLRQLLMNTPITGLVTNRDFLISLLNHRAFQSGEVHTGFIPQHEDGLLDEPNMSSKDYALAAVASFVSRKTGDDPWDIRDSFRANLPNTTLYWFTNDQGADVKVALVQEGESYRALIGDDELIIGQPFYDDGYLTFTVNGVGASVFADVTSASVTLVSADKTLEVKRKSLVPPSSEADGPGTVLAPMPGKILDVKVESGDAVSKGQPLLVMEAMKMEQTITAPRDGHVNNLSLKQGDQIKGGSVLLTVEDSE